MQIARYRRGKGLQALGLAGGQGQEEIYRALQDNQAPEEHPLTSGVTA